MIPHVQSFGENEKNQNYEMFFSLASRVIFLDQLSSGDDDNVIVSSEDFSDHSWWPLW